MSKFSNTIEYTIQTKLDSSGLDKLQKQLAEVQKSFLNMQKTTSNADDIFGLKDSVQEVGKLQKALAKSFDSNLGIMNVSKFTSELQKAGTSLTQLETTMRATPEGAKAFNSMVGSIGQIDTGFKSISSVTDKIMNTFGNTVRWGITASIFQTIQNSLYRSVDYVKELDTSLNNIQIVTGATSENLRNFSKTANEAAQQLGASTVAFTDAAQLYAQNGYSQEDYTKLAELTTKVANVTQQSTSDVSEQITSLMAGYKMSIDEAEDALSGMAVVAAESASDLGELANAEQKVASAANTLGVSQDQLTAQLSTIISVTREAPESVGNSLKTIYARLGDLKLGETLEDGVSLGDVSGSLEKIGVSVMDVNGEMRDMGDILEDLMGKWQDLSTAQQQAAAVKLAGKYQYNNFMTLMSNSDMYYQQKAMAGGSQGALDEQQAIYMDSLQAKIQKLQTTWEGFVNDLVDPDSFKPAIDGLSDILNTASDLIGTLGGAGPVLTLFGSLMTKSFSQSIATGVTNMYTNAKRSGIQASNEQTIRNLGGTNTNSDSSAMQFLQQTSNVRQSLSPEQKESYNKVVQGLVNSDNDLIEANTRLQESMKSTGVAIDDVKSQLASLGMEVDEATDFNTLLTTASQKVSASQHDVAVTTQAQNLVRDIGTLGTSTFNTVLDNGTRQSSNSQDILSTLSRTFSENDIFKNVSDEALTYSDSFGEFKDLYDTIQQQVEEAKSAEADSEELDKIVENILSNVEKMLAKAEAIKKSENVVNPINDAATKAVEDLEKNQSEQKAAAAGLEAQIKAASEKATQATAEVNKIKSEIGSQDFTQTASVQSYTDSLMKLAGAAGQAVFALQGFANIGKIISDDDLDAGEKFVQVLQNLIFVVPTVVSGVSTVVDSINNMSDATDAYNKSVAKKAELEGALDTANVAKDAADAAVENLKAGKSATDAAEDAAKAGEKVKKAAEGVTEAVGDVAEKGETAGKVIKDVTEKTTNAGKAASGASGLLGTVLSGAFADLTTAARTALTTLRAVAPYLAVFAAVGAVIGAISWHINQQEEEKQATRDNAAAALEYSNNLSTLKKTYEDTYSAYKEGKASSDELKTAADNLNDVLGDQTAKVAAANGEWETYNSLVNSASSKKLVAQDLIVKNGFEQAAADYASAPGLMGAVQVIKNVATTNSAISFGNDQSLIDAYNNASSVSVGANGNFRFVAGSSTHQRIKDMDDLTDTFQQKVDELNAKLPSLVEGTDEYEQTLQQLDDAQEHLSGIQQLRAQYADEEATYQQSLQDTASALVFAHGSDSAFQMTDGMSMDEYASNIKQRLLELGYSGDEVDDLVQTIIEDMGELSNSTADNIQKIKTAAAANESRTGFAQGIYTKAVNSINGMSNNEKNSILNGGTSEQYGDYVASGLIDKIQNSQLTDQEQINFIAGIDWNKSLPEIIAQVDKINEDSDALPELEFQAGTASNFTDRSSFSDDKIADLLDSEGMSESAFNRMASATFDSDAMQESAKAIEDEIKSLQESGDASDEAKDKIKELRQEYEDLGSTAKDITAYNLQMNRGLSKLVSSWENYADVLKNDVADGTSDYYKAVGELDEIMSDLLNIDVGVLSDDFYKNTDAINAMEAAANGDASAIDTLRQLASEDVIMHLDIQNISDEDKDYLINEELLPMLSDFQAQLDTMPLGMSVDVDTDPFILKLNDLLSKGQLTAEQVSNILSSIGMDATIGQETQTVTQTYTQMFPKMRVETSDDGAVNLVPDGLVQVQGEATENVSFPTIQGATYTGKGITTAGSSSKRGGKKSSGSGSGGKSGGSGSGKSYEPKTKDKDESNLDRYEKVNAHLDKIAASLEKLQAAQDRLTGKKLTENLAQQTKLLQEQVKWEEQKLEIERQEAAEYRGILSSQYGVGFDSDGFITNYADIYNQLYGAYSSAVDRYNADTTEAGQEAAEKEVESAKKRLDNFSNYIDKYDTLLTSTITSSEKKIQDYYDKIEDIQIEAFKKTIDAANNIKDLQERMIEFNAVFRSIAHDKDADEPFNDMVTNAQKLSKYWDVDTTSMSRYYDELIKSNKEALAQSGISNEKRNWLLSRANMYENAKAQLGKGTLESGGTGYLDMVKTNVEDILEQMRQFEETGTSSIFGENSADLYDVAKTVFENATDMVSDYKDELDDLKSNVMDGIDEIGNAIDDLTDKFDNINDTLDTYLDMIELVSGDQAYDKMNEVLSAQVRNSKAEIDVLQNSIKQLQELQSTFEEGSDQWNAVAEQIQDKQSKLLELTSDTMDKMNSIYSNNVNAQLDKWLAGTPLGSDLDWMSDQWELINRNEDQYLDKTNSAYNIQKLQAKYLDLLDQSDNLLTQQKITDQMNQQLQMLRAKDKLSQYDVDYANAQLEILQKTIALQDAQNNKSQMKLKRDSQGNYSYVYGANEGDVKNAQSDLLDAQNNAYNLSKDQMKQVQDDSLSALQDAKSMLTDIWTNANLTLEEKTKRTQTIIDSLKEYLAGTADQLSTSEQNIIQDFIGMCELMTDENKEGLQDVHDQIIAGNDDAFNEIDSRWGDSVAQWLKDMDSFNAATDDAFDGLRKDAEDYQKSIDDLGSQVGTDFGNMTDAINKTKESTDALTSSTDSFYSKLKELTGQTQTAEAELQKYREKILDINNAMGTMQGQINDLGNKLTAKEQENANLSSQLDALQQKYNAATSGGSGSGGSGSYSGDVESTAFGIAQNIWTYGSWDNNPVRRERIISRYGEDVANRAQEIVNEYVYSGRAGELYNPASGVYGYATGGYTGTWSSTNGGGDGNNGKLAFLHQKELVLNETDTANILEAIKNVREMANAFSSNGILSGMTSLDGLVKDAIKAISGADKDMNVTQDIIINADFPNVSSYQEIERAFTDLNNAAIQYAARVNSFGRN